MQTKKSKPILIGLIILIVISLNFFLLNKVIGHSNTPTTFEKNLRLTN